MTTTSGAAIQRYKIGYHADEWGRRSSTPSGIPDASGSWVRYADHVNALAAGQATAAQPGVVYAEQPVPNCPKSGGFPGTFAEAQMHAFADAAHTLRTSHEQAPADYLAQREIPFVPKNGGAHLIVEGKDCFIDFWPGTGKWHSRCGKKGFGVRNLVAFIETPSNA